MFDLLQIATDSIQKAAQFAAILHTDTNERAKQIALSEEKNKT